MIIEQTLKDKKVALMARENACRREIDCWDKDEEMKKRYSFEHRQSIINKLTAILHSIIKSDDNTR